VRDLNRRVGPIETPRSHLTSAIVFRINDSPPDAWQSDIISAVWPLASTRSQSSWPSGLPIIGSFVQMRTPESFSLTATLEAGVCSCPT
jgi:hypothetical protein